MSIDLANALEEDLSWREHELASLKLTVIDSDPGSTRQLALLRALWALVYAHYEGFCKFAWDQYLEVIEELGPIRRDCSECVAQLSLAKEFKALKADLSPEGLWGFCTGRFATLMAEPAKFALRLETESNLWPSLLKENSSRVGLKLATLDANDMKLRSLVARRNEIAHGQKMTIASLSEYQPYEDAAVLVMHELAVAVIEAVEQRSFTR